MDVMALYNPSEFSQVVDLLEFALSVLGDTDSLLQQARAKVQDVAQRLYVRVQWQLLVLHLTTKQQHIRP